MEKPLSPQDPDNQGIRVELLLNQTSVLGPTVVFRGDLEEAPVYLRANRSRCADVLRAAGDGAEIDVQLVIHGSVANAPYAALFLLRNYGGEAIDVAPVPATPLLQVQPSTPGDRWHVAGQANLRVKLSLQGMPRLKVLH